MRRRAVAPTTLAKPRSFADAVAMARYFFNVVEDGHKVDTVGADYSTPEIARMEAVRFVGQLLKDESERLWKGAEIRVEATDEWGTVLFTLLVAAVDAEALRKHK
jgi:hypothetical protein